MVLAPYAAVLALALLTRSLLVGDAVPYISIGQEFLWSWPMTGVLVAAILLGARMAPLARIPAPLDRNVPIRARFIWPAGVGAVIAVAIIATDIAAPAAAARGVTTLHIPFPTSVPFYIYGAILLTALFHFLPLVLVDWALVATGLRARPFFAWCALLLLAFSEDARYFMDWHDVFSAESLRHCLSYLANASELVFIRHFGLLAGLTQRMATYLGWHIIWGAFG